MSLKLKSSWSLVKYYQLAKFENGRVINNTEIADCAILIECHLVTFTFDLGIHTAILQVIIYQLAKYKKDLMKTSEKSSNADGGKEIK